nr:hypothetical protein [Corynebacterium xerosis]
MLGLAVFVALAVAAIAWPSVAAAVTAVVMGAAAVVITLGWHIPAAPPGWIIGACADGGRVRVVTAASLDDAHAPSLPRPCRLALERGVAGHVDESEVEVHASLDDVEDSVGGGSGAGRSDVSGPDRATESTEFTAVPRWIVVENCGERARVRIRTAEGVPVVCPVRDGVHALYPDGAVWRNGSR